MSAVRTLNILSIGLILGSALFLVYRVSGSVAYSRQEGLEALDANEQVDAYLEWLRGQLAEPKYAKLETLPVMAKLADDVEATKKVSNRLARRLVTQGTLPRIFHRLWDGDAELEELYAVQRRQKAQMRDLRSLVEEFIERRGESAQRCYCSCAGRGGTPSARGRRTATQCEDLCRGEGYARAICT
jgi:hypothetical protein